MLRSAVAKLVCAFVFAQATCRFSYVAAHLLVLSKQNKERDANLYHIMKDKMCILILNRDFVFRLCHYRRNN